MKHKNIAIFVPHAGCPHRCAFCDQHTITGHPAPPAPDEVEAVCREAVASFSADERAAAEIAFFGGSFTALPRGYMTALLEAAAPYAAKCRGIRLSTRPDAVDASVLETLHQYGVTAVELGAQSMDDAVLAANGRGHTAADVSRASDLIRAAGMELGLQIMPGLYTADAASDRRTVEAVCAIGPDTVRIYPTVILKGTRLAALHASGAYVPRPFDEMVTETAAAMETFRARGIRVIKVGLHASDGVSAEAVGGYYHPAFRELCESRLYRARIEAALTGIRPGETCAVRVHPRCISKAVGQKRANVRYFQDTYGIGIRICGDEAVPPFQVHVGGNACF